MPRIKLTMPSPVRHITEISVRITDLNYGNHLANDRILTLAHEARIEFFLHYGLTEMSIGDDTSLIMSDAAIQFKAEGFYGDILVIETAITEFSNKGFELYHRFVKKADGSDLAIVKTGMVCFDYTTRNVLPVPDSFRTLFK